MNINHSSDAELVGAALAGSREAFGSLVERHQRFACALAYSKTGSVTASEDIAQDAFLAAWKNLPTLRAPGNFRGFLAGTVRNLAAKFHRGKFIAVPLSAGVPSGSSPSEDLMSREEEAMLWATLERLPAAQREPLVLFHRGGQSIREIAAILDLSEEAVKQRLSRGRAMLREAVREKVETALARSRPGAVFTLSVLAALPALTTSAQAAGAGIALAKGAGATSMTSILPMLGGGIAGVMGAWLGFRWAMDRAESERERIFLHRAMMVAIAWTAGLLTAMTALLLWGRALLDTHPTWWIALMAGTIFTFVALNVIFSLVNGRIQKRIRVEERVRRGRPADEPTPQVFEFRSSVRLLGLPLVHVCFGGSWAVAKGWVAIGPVAISPLLAFGGIALGPVALGGLSVGLFVLAGMGIGLLSFSGLAVGGVAIGGLALGGIAIGGAAWGWLGAFGGWAWSTVYGLGRHATAPHANDAAAKAFFEDHGLTQAAGWIAMHGFWIQLAILLPVMVLFWWVRRMMRRADG